MGSFRIPPQIVRLLLLTVGIVTSYFVARYFLKPPSFGEYGGWYRGAALEEIASREPIYSGKKSCDECHTDVLTRLGKGDHKTLSCEGCHGVSREHASNPDVTPIKMTANHCIRCHEENPSRPSWFKQIVVKDHFSGKCTECHLPHQPKETP